MVEYSIYKDRNPIETVKIIKKILSDNDISVDEILTSEDKNKNELVPSVRVCLKGIEIIGTNGKGTCIDNARASGYAEFMERIQNGFLLSLEIPDIVSSENDNNKKLSQLEFVPFYGVKEQKIINLPRKLINIQQGSNGLAAGNTFEEALVQGISEICERYVVKQVILNNLSLPDIPEEIYMKYDKINKIVKLYRSYGYEVHIKDASIGKNLPVICTVLVKEKEDIMTVSWGAHPTLAIAIERTLTEVFQGKDLNIDKKYNEILSNFLFLKKYKNNLSNLVQFLNISSPIYEMNDYVKNEFILKEPDFKFNKNVWLYAASGYTNKDLLKFLINNIKSIANNNIYIRDVSFLGFPSIQIYIPKMSKCEDIKFSDEKNLKNWVYFNKNTKEKWADDINSLISALKLKDNNCCFYSNYKISVLPDEYLLLLCSLLIKDYNKAFEYAEILLFYNKNKKIEFTHNKGFLIEQIKDYCELQLKNIENEKIDEILKNRYGEKEKNLLHIFLKNLNFDIIKNIILVNKLPKKYSEEVENNLNRIKKHLSELYKNNLPNQNNLKAIFDFID